MSDTAAAPPKGPRVFLDYDQAELDRCYDQSIWAPNQAIVHERGDLNSARARAALGEPERMAYGVAPIEKLDLFRTREHNAPTLIYVHGGAWRNGASSRCHAPAEMFVNAGVNFIALDFTNVVETGGDLYPMVEQVRRAVAWVYRFARTFDADPEKLFVFGHSSGAHLTGNILTTDWPSLHHAPYSILKGGIVCSGMYDLAPVRLSARSKYVNFSDQMVEDLSSIRHLNRLHCPVIVAVGDRESPEFLRQNRDFFAAVEKSGRKATFLLGQGYNHFEIAETLANPYGLLGRAALAMIGAHA